MVCLLKITFPENHSYKNIITFIWLSLKTSFHQIYIYRAYRFWPFWVRSLFSNLFLDLFYTPLVDLFWKTDILRINKIRLGPISISQIKMSDQLKLSLLLISPMKTTKTPFSTRINQSFGTAPGLEFRISKTSKSNNFALTI